MTAADALVPTMAATPDLVESDLDIEALSELAMAADPVLAVDAVADPLYATASTLPEFYMPGSMSGPRSRWMVTVSLVLIALFLLATVLGVCLTDGYPIWG